VKTSVKLIIAFTPIDRIVTGLAVDYIIAFFTINYVYSGVAMNRILKLTAPNKILPGARDNTSESVNVDIRSQNNEA